MDGNLSALNDYYNSQMEGFYHTDEDLCVDFNIFGNCIVELTLDYVKFEDDNAVDYQINDNQEIHISVYCEGEAYDTVCFTYGEVKKDQTFEIAFENMIENLTPNVF